MKKVEVKTVKKTTKKESEIKALTRLVVDGFKKVNEKIEKEIESLARSTRDGFEQVDKRFEQVDKRFEQVDKRFEQVDNKFESLESKMGSQFFAVHQELKEHRERLERIERKQTGMLTNLDETVHRSEFSILLKRVDQLEKKIVKK